ncbi:hypothetical protein FGB62_5g261 [Gracilaria domingensis]|nr:hypothetical protein FGB62_5g261 [Gracilaria domingensis]
MIWPDFLRSQLHRTLYDAPRRFAVAESLDNHPFSQIRVAQVGSVPLPLPQAHLSSLGDVGEQVDLAPGSHFDDEQPIISRLQIDAANVQLSIEHQSFISSLTREVVTRLDVSHFSLRTKLDKLVIYGRHGHCESHSQNELASDAFATLIVQLPTSYNGGQLHVRHGGQTQDFDMTHGSQSRLHWAIFFSHCECERFPVTSGHCVSLIYRVVRSAPGPLPNFESRCDSSHMLKEAAALWEAMPAKLRPIFLAIPLEHVYGLNELSFAKLRGSDAKRALQLRNSDKYIMFLVLVHKTDCGVLSKDPGTRYFYLSPSGEDAAQNRKSFSPIHQMKEVQETNVTVVKLVKENDRELRQIRLDDFWNDRPICDKEHFLHKKGLFEDSKPYAELYDPFSAKVVPPLQFTYREAALIFWPRTFHAHFFCSQSFELGARYVVQAFENKDADSRSILEQVIAYGKHATLSDNDGALRLLQFSCSIQNETVAANALEFMVRVERNRALEEEFPYSFCQGDMGCSSSAHADAFLKAICMFNWERIRDPMLVAIKATPSDCFGNCLYLAHSVPKENRLSEARNDVRRTLALSVLSKCLPDRTMPEAANVLFSFPSLVSQQKKFLEILAEYSVERMALLLEELHHLILEDGTDCGAAVLFARMVPVFISKDLGTSEQGSKKGSKDMLKSYVSMSRPANSVKNVRYSRSSALVFSLLVDSRTLNEDLLRQFVHAALDSRRRKLLGVLVQLIPAEGSMNPNVNEIFDSLKSFHTPISNRPE